MPKLNGKVRRVMSDDDGAVNKTIIGVGPRDDEPPFLGAVATLFGAMQGCFAAFVFTDPAEAAKWPRDKLVTVTLGE